MRTARLDVFVLSATLACALLVITGEVDAFRQQQNPAVGTQQHSRLILDGTGMESMNRIRGGSSAVDVEIESSDVEETDDEDEEEVPTLAKATKKAATKAVKKSVAAAMKTPQKKSFKLGELFKLPYIVKACLNPVVFFQMTAGYWKSLYNINYMAENVADSSQGLRSALEQKARHGGGGKKPSRGKRKMKPGQAKTLSDLPALNT